MDKKLPAKRRPTVLQPALLLSIGVSGYGLVLAGMFFFLIFSSIIAQSPASVVLYMFLFALVFRLVVGQIIETYLAVRLLGMLEREQYGRAERMYVTWLRAWQKLPVIKGGRLGLGYSNLALMMILQGKYEAAEAPLRAAIQLIETDRRLKKHYVAAVPINNLSIVLIEQEKYIEAEELARRALKIYENAKSKKTCGAAFPLLSLGKIYLRQGYLEEAEEFLTRARDLLRTEARPFLILQQSIEHAKLISDLNVALLLAKQGKIESSKKLGRECLTKMETRPYDFTIAAVNVVNQLALCLADSGDTELAENLLERAYALARSHPDHPHATKLLDTYAQLLDKTGRVAEIPDMKRWIRPVLLSNPLT